MPQLAMALMRLGGQERRVRTQDVGDYEDKGWSIAGRVEAGGSIKYDKKIAEFDRKEAERERQERDARARNIAAVGAAGDAAVQARLDELSALVTAANERAAAAEEAAVQAAEAAAAAAGDGDGDGDSKSGK